MHAYDIYKISPMLNKYNGVILTEVCICNHFSIVGMNPLLGQLQKKSLNGVQIEYALAASLHSRIFKALTWRSLSFMNGPLKPGKYSL